MLNFTRPRPFRFEHFWLGNDEVKPIIEKVQRLVTHHPLASPLEILSSKLNTLQALLKHWNNTRFGFTPWKLRLLRSRSSYRPLSKKTIWELPRLLQCLRTAYNLHSALLRQVCMKSKARVDWNLKGDANTAFFHRTTLMHRRRNRILQITDRDNETYTTDNQIRRVFTLHYSTLWATNDAINASNLLFLPFTRKLDPEAHDVLCRPFSSEEILILILRALHQLPNGKAPGPDGYHAEFYRTYWSVLGPGLLSALQAFHIKPELPSSWGSTYLCFIPKCENPSMVKHYHPIALCNVLYRLLVKVLDNRLSRFIPHLIGVEQSAFIKGRNIKDNILLMVAHSLSAHKRSKSTVLLKLDLEKAFDSVSWVAIKNVLLAMNFTLQWVDWIMACVSSPVFSCLLNGSNSAWFKSSRGIRQASLPAFICASYGNSFSFG